MCTHYNTHDKPSPIKKKSQEKYSSQISEMRITNSNKLYDKMVIEFIKNLKSLETSQKSLIFMILVLLISSQFPKLLLIASLSIVNWMSVGRHKLQIPWRFINVSSFRFRGFLTPFRFLFVFYCLLIKCSHSFHMVPFV